VATIERLSVDKRRQQLLEVGLELFGTRPYGDVATAELAQAAGVSHGLLFHYFGDKRRYYLAVLEWVAERLFSAQLAAEEESSPWQLLQKRLRVQIDFAARYTIAYKALVSGGNGADAELAELVEAARWRAIGLITEALAIEEPTPQLRIALRGWSGFADGAIIEWLKRRELSVDELVDLLARALLDTLKQQGVDLARAKRKRRA
jgi:AcrR family transcriptional regulator